MCIYILFLIKDSLENSLCQHPHVQEQPAFDKKQFIAYIKKYIKNLTPKLEPERQEVFKKHIEGATKYLLSKLKDFQL